MALEVVVCLVSLPLKSFLDHQRQLQSRLHSRLVHFSAVHPKQDHFSQQHLNKQEQRVYFLAAVVEVDLRSLARTPVSPVFFKIRTCSSENQRSLLEKRRKKMKVIKSRNKMKRQSMPRPTKSSLKPESLSLKAPTPRFSM